MSGDEGVALLLEPLADAELVLGGAKQPGDLQRGGRAPPVSDSLLLQVLPRRASPTTICRLSSGGPESP